MIIYIYKWHRKKTRFLTIAAKSRRNPAAACYRCQRALLLLLLLLDPPAAAALARDP
jgi:hypothetical protein